MRERQKLITILLALIAACGGEPVSRPVATTRDSAGIRIVENAVPTAVAATLGNAPMLVLGELDGPEPEQFGRSIDARLIPDGVAVLDPMNFRIVLFGLDGRLRRTIGREGEGPGDMRRASHLVSVNGDTVRLWDHQLRRVTTYDTAGRVLGSMTLLPGEARESKGLRYTLSPVPRARLADGRLVATTPAAFRVNPGTAVHQDSVIHWLVDSVGVARPHATRASGRSWSYEFVGRSFWADTVPYAPRAADAFTGSAWFRVEGDRFEVTERSWSGATRRLIRTGRVRQPVTDADRTRFEDSERASTDPGNHEDLRVIHDWLTYPDSMPAYDQLVVDATGVVWARVFPDTATLATWDLFDSRGGLLGTARLPAALVVRDITAEHLLAERKGELDEPLVVLYRLSRRR